MKDFLKSEFINGKTAFDWVYLAIGIAMQCLGIWYGFYLGTPDNPITIISGLAGVVSVVLCAQCKISFYAFGYIQLLTYVFGVVIPNHLWGEAVENIFYFVTMVYGTFVWWKNYNVKEENGAGEVKARKLSPVGWVITMGGLVIGTAVLTYVLGTTNDPEPFLDAISTIPAFIAQILMCLGYREQWLHWCIIDVASVIMYVTLGSWVMVAQFVFWTINCIYGWYKWTKNNKYYV